MSESTKARTLEALRGKITSARVLPMIIFTVKEWREGRRGVLEKAAAQSWGKDSLIVRSSALNEDTGEESKAGAYESVPHVSGERGVEEAVERVIASYGERRTGDDEVFIQPMLRDVALSGVLFTMDPNTGGHYYVVNYDDKTGSTSSVTSGSGAGTKIFYRFKGYGGATGFSILDKVIGAAEEVAGCFRRDALDIEFAVSARQEVYILQVRPLVIRLAVKDMARQEAALKRSAGYIRRSLGKKPYIFGERPVYGVMPDWNPAEIVGVRPKPLALSLYKNLVTDGTWAYQRDSYGYKDLRSFPLIIDFAGLPYIDARVSFNSFVPKSIEADLADKLVNYYLSQLIEHPEMHDKVEFEIIFSCYTFDLQERVEALRKHGFSQGERRKLAESLRVLTNRVIDVDNGLWVEDARKIDVLKRRHREIMDSDLSRVGKVYWLLEDCRRYGTLPFAGLARAGFVAVQILRSLVSCGVFSQEEYNGYIAGLNTVSTNMAKDFAQLRKEAFLSEYGHLRPGMYDICSPRYDEAPDRYFNWEAARNTASYEREFRLTVSQLERIRELLKKFDLSDDVLALFQFLKGAIEGREYSKFVFSKNVSDALVMIGEIGAGCGFDKEDLSYMDIEIWKGLYNSERDVGDGMAKSITQGKERHQDALGFTMPPVIAKPDDCYYFHLDDAAPNFITLNKAAGPVSFETDGELEGSILMIPSADPGYDWIFSKNIAGFITKYGGANSHMSIRAGELSLPAIVGAGEKLYNRLARAEYLELDCALKKVEVIK
jgi:phosphohistidine swiveling domain-containing protein